MTDLIWHVEKRNLKDLKTWDKNPRQITEEKYNKLKQRIIERGFHATLTIDENNVVLSGNQRLRALLELGWTEVECKVPNRPLNEEERDKVGLESNISDGETDFDILSNEFETDTLIDVGFTDEQLGISTDEIDDKIINSENYQQKFAIIIELESEEAQQQLYNQLNEQGYKCRIMSI